MGISDHETFLLNGLAAGEKSAVEAIYLENYLIIQAFILNNNGSVDDARDIFQEAMVVLFDRSKDASFELKCLIKTYLYSVCRRMWLKRLQQNSKFVAPVEHLQEIVSVEDELDHHIKINSDFQLMGQALGKIGEPCKGLLEAYYFQKKSMVEIAAEYGYTNADNAKTQKYKCLIRLKKIFFSQYKMT